MLDNFTGPVTILDRITDTNPPKLCAVCGRWITLNSLCLKEIDRKLWAHIHCAPDAEGQGHIPA